MTDVTNIERWFLKDCLPFKKFGYYIRLAVVPEAGSDNTDFFQCWAHEEDCCYRTRPSLLDSYDEDYSTYTSNALQVVLNSNRLKIKEQYRVLRTRLHMSMYSKVPGEGIHNVNVKREK